MEFPCQGQRAKQIFITELLKEARMRKDWCNDEQNYRDGEKHVHKKKPGLKLDDRKDIRIKGEKRNYPRLKRGIWN